MVDTEEQRKAIEAQKQQCIFCKIVKDEIKAKKVYEDDKIIAILDIYPLVRGHVLVMPKEHFVIAPAIPQDILSHMFRRVKNISSCMKKALVNFGYTMFIANGAIAGQQSYHFMLHIVPGDKAVANFIVPSGKIKEDDMKKNIDSIKKAMNVTMARHFQSLGKQIPPKVMEVIQPLIQGSKK